MLNVSSQNKKIKMLFLFKSPLLNTNFLSCQKQYEREKGKTPKGIKRIIKMKRE